MLGSFGTLIFQVSSKKIRTFDDFVRETSDRWAEHEIIGEKPKSEFLGPGLDRVSFTVRFDVKHGVDPRTEMDRLLKMSRTGQVATLIIGGKRLGINKWKIKTLAQKWTTVDSRGKVLVGVMEITLEEYV